MKDYRKCWRIIEKHTFLPLFSPKLYVIQQLAIPHESMSQRCFWFLDSPFNFFIAAWYTKTWFFFFFGAMIYLTILYQYLECLQFSLLIVLMTEIYFKIIGYLSLVTFSIHTVFFVTLWYLDEFSVFLRLITAVFCR